MISSLLGTAALGLALIVLLYRAAWMMERQERKAWERRARAAGWHPEITPAIAERIVKDLFPRPMGARGWNDAASLSTEQDAQRLREWREHRALHALDHHRKHFAEGATDSECAREILVFCIGGNEVDE